MFVIISLAVWILAVTVAITIHEFAHAFVADKLGDPTARVHDRLSLNPLKHYDQVGSTMLLLTSVMAALGANIIPLGWAKPVPFDPYNLANPKRDGALIALAGPVSNLLLAGLLSFLLRTFFLEVPIINLISLAFITLNVALAIFNLIPIHPLDGSKILYGLLPTDLAVEYDEIMRRYGMFLLIFLIVPISGRSAIGSLISPAISSLLQILLP
jgi:Zn-dependent protease